MAAPDRRRSRGRWLVVVWAIALGLTTWMQLGDVTGDEGLANVASFALCFLATLITLIWFTLRSGFPRRVRFGVLGAVVALVVLAGVLFRVDSFAGEMQPIFAFRFSEAPDRALAVPDAPVVAPIDLRTTTPHDFPEFLGPGRDLRVDGVTLARDWERRPPELLWRQPIGAGWSGFSVVNGFAATLEQRGDEQLVTLYRVADGELLWARATPGRFESVIAGRGPRSTPTIDDGVVYAMGVFGRLAALDGATGEVLWEHDLPSQYGSSVEVDAVSLPYGRPASPLIVGEAVIVPVGGGAAGRASLVAFDKKSGARLWDAGNRQISMASPAIATLAGRRQLLVVHENWVSGHDPATGSQLWEFEWPGITNADANVSQAVAVPPDRVFISKGYGSGAAMYRLEPGADGAFDAVPVWHSPRVLRTKLTNVAIRGGYAYGLSEGILECVDIETGERAWKAGRYYHGQILMVGELLLVLSEEGEVFLVEATPERPNEVLGRFQAIDGNTWNNLALYRDVLLVRNGQEAAAYRLPLEGATARFESRRAVVRTGGFD